MTQRLSAKWSVAIENIRKGRRPLVRPTEEDGEDDMAPDYDAPLASKEETEKEAAAAKEKEATAAKNAAAEPKARYLSGKKNIQPDLETLAEIRALDKTEQPRGDKPWVPKTMSVVLPCANEHEYARKTVESV